MKFIKFLVLSLLILLSTNPTIHSQSQDETENLSVKSDIPVHWALSNVQSSIPESKKIEIIVDRFLSQKEMVGLSVSIAKDGKMVYAKGFGFSDSLAHTVVEPKNIFRVASVSKVITATAIMKLQEEGKLTLDDHVFGEDGIISDVALMPYRDPKLKDITVRNLLQHSGGWTQRYGDPMFHPLQIVRSIGSDAPADASDFLKFVTSRRLHFRPGAMSVYSNLGYFLLGEVIARASDMSYEQYVKTHIFYPIGIEDIHLAQNYAEDHFSNEVTYYEPKGSLPISSYDGTGREQPKVDGGNDVRLLGAAGGWVASPIELLKLALAIDGDSSREDILSPESVAEMKKFKRGFPPLGWRRIRNGSLIRTGSMAGTQALVVVREDGYSYSIVTNTSSWRGAAFASDLDRLVNSIIRNVNHWPDHDLFDYYEPKSVDNLPVPSFKEKGIISDIKASLLKEGDKS